LHKKKNSCHHHGQSVCRGLLQRSSRGKYLVANHRSVERTDRPRRRYRAVGNPHWPEARRVGINKPAGEAIIGKTPMMRRGSSGRATGGDQTGAGQRAGGMCRRKGAQSREPTPKGGRTKRKGNCSGVIHGGTKSRKKLHITSLSDRHDIETVKSD